MQRFRKAAGSVGVYLLMAIMPSVLGQLQPALEYVPGIFKQNLSLQIPIYYNTYAPILLEYKIPKFDVNSLTLTPLYALYDFCKKPEYSQQCPPTFFIKQLISGSFSGNLSSWNSLPEFNSGSINHTIDSINFCDDLTSHFTDFKTSAHHLESYMSKLVECSISNSNATSITRAIRDYEYHLKDFYANYVRSVERTFYDQTDSQTDDVAALNAHTAAYGIFLVHSLMESQRWTNALSSCRAGQVPSTLVTSHKLTSALHDIESRATQRNYKLSISVNQLSKYYKLPLTDCVLVDGGSLLVRILVPIVQKTAKYEHIKIDTLPFLKSKDEVCFVSKSSDREVVFDHNSGQILESSCKPNELCKLPRHPSDWPFTVNHCISSFLLGRRDGVQTHCHMDCMPFANADPIFKTINASTVVVAGRFSPNLNTTSLLSVKCDGKEAELIEPLHSFYQGNSSIGALRIHLPCNCRLNYNQKTVFKSGSAHCDSGVQMSFVHILPYAWEREARDNSTEDTIIDNYDVGDYGDQDDYAAEENASPESTETDSDNDMVLVPIEFNCHLGIMYTLSVLMLFLVVAVSFILLKLMQIERWRRRQESEGDKHPIMSYHVFNDQQDLNSNIN